MASEPSSEGFGFRGQARGRPFETFEGAERSASLPSPARTRISDLVYEELSEAIRSLRLPPGAPLSEPAVAAWLEVSRAPVREAFTRLADQKLITIAPQVGSRVAPISMSGVEDAVFIRNALEKSAFEQAITFDDLDTTELHSLVDRNREAAMRGDAEDFFESDEQLHQLVFALAGVPRMWQVVRGTKVQLDRLRRLNLSGALTNAEVLDEHQGIVDALDARDAIAGARMIHRHSHRILTDTTKLREEYPDFFVA
ncbi:GntR family transcriptional regulator [Microbacterium deminutum]|uniref:GntR family transcriptional regulator n=1 Tax=Microbacterium deminutum TaxID=344164 RepID=A0ABN2R5E8_9MICO